MATLRSMVFTAGGKDQEAKDADTQIVSGIVQNGSGSLTFNAQATSVIMQVAGVTKFTISASNVTVVNGIIAPTVGPNSTNQHTLPAVTSAMVVVTSAQTNHGVLLAQGSGSPATATLAGTAGQPLTSNGIGADPTFQDPITATFASVTGDQTDLTVDDTYTNITNLQVTLPSAGTYLVQAQIVAAMSVTLVDGQIVAHFYNSTDSADVANSERTCLMAGTPSTDFLATTTIIEIITVAASKTIKVQAKRISGATYNVSSILSDSGNGYSRMSYTKIDYN